MFDQEGAVARLQIKGRKLGGEKVYDTALRGLQLRKGAESAHCAAQTTQRTDLYNVHSSTSLRSRNSAKHSQLIAKTTLWYGNSKGIAKTKKHQHPHHNSIFHLIFGILRLLCNARKLAPQIVLCLLKWSLQQIWR